MGSNVKDWLARQKAAETPTEAPLQRVARALGARIELVKPVTDTPEPSLA